jgi:hypothetical protein
MEGGAGTLAVDAEKDRSVCGAVRWIRRSGRSGSDRGRPSVDGRLRFGMNGNLRDRNVEVDIYLCFEGKMLPLISSVVLAV